MPQKSTRNWIAGLLPKEEFIMEPMALRESKGWRLEEGVIRHRSRRFFSVVGVSAVDAQGKARAFPLLDQPEIGLLAILTRDSAQGPEILVQAKAEPGNVGVIQLAPSYQATSSNTDRVHGGDAPPMHDWFLSGSHGVRWLANTLQSEQGTRFNRKRNRNAMLHCGADSPEAGERHRWVSVRELCRMLSADHLLNTDLRSTLVCGDWAVLAGGRPFAGGGVAEGLRASHELPEAASRERVAAVLEALAKPEAWQEAPRVVALEDLPGWKLGEEGPEPVGKAAMRIRHRRIRLRSREVAEWDQPLLESTGLGEVVLPMGLHQGVPHFLFRLRGEAGFGLRRELTAAVTTEPGGDAGEPVPALDALLARGKTLASCLQSDEGGRFLHDESRYSVVDVGEAQDIGTDFHWLSLGQVRQLLARGEALTNEARSALSLLFAWL